MPDLKSGDIVRLSAYVRCDGKYGGIGIIGLTAGTKFSPYFLQSTSSSDTLWNRISITDTLNLAPGDSVWVILSSPITELVPFRQLFDLVKLERISP